MSEEQNCSVPKRTIFNNLFLTRDIIRFNKEKYIPLYILLYILQIDQEKAFDKIDINFSFKTMESLGFSNTFINFIKILYTNNIAMIISNGYFSAPVYPERGLRQGCPLSLPLYVVQAEITTYNINQDQNIKGIKIPNKSKEIKIPQYVDDSNFYLKNQESVINVIKFFQKLNLATGATINQEKTKILPINTDNTNTLRQKLTNLTMKDQYDTIHILGITLCEGMKQTCLLNWQIILQKMEKHINKLSSRHLSLNGKAILLNTLIRAKCAYLSNVFPIPDKMLSKIYKEIFHYLCQNKNIETIARKATFLPKQKVGLNIKEPNIHNIAMRLKHLQNLQKSENQPPWMFLATYWLAKDIHNYGLNYSYLKRNYRSKTTNQKNPFCNEDLIIYIKRRNKTILSQKNETKIIY